MPGSGADSTAPAELKANKNKTKTHTHTHTRVISIMTRHFIVDVPGGLQANLRHMTRSDPVVSVPWKKENYKDPSYTTQH